MKYAVAELSGALLDAAVAKAMGWIVDGAWCTDPTRPHDPIHLGMPGEWAYGEHFAPSQRWEDGGPIIERDQIATAWSGDQWMAFLWQHHSGYKNGYIDVDAFKADGLGPTPPIAAMRAYCHAKFGETVELP
jgi:hypothetical protein